MNLLPKLLLAVAATTTAISAQTLNAGYQSQLQALPTSAGNVLALAGNQVVWFDGNDLWLTGQGQPPRSLLHFALPVFGSFTIQVDATTLLFGESSSNNLWLVPQNSPPSSTPLANLVFNYDAVLLAPGTALVSAKTSGFGTPDNDLIAVDLATGTTQPLALLPGASGPLAIAPNGDLYYATSSLSFPTPPGQTTVLRFRRPVVDQALAAHQVLGVAQAEVVITGLDAAADLAFDDDGDLLFTDWWSNTVGEVNDATGPAPWRTNLTDYTGAAVSASAVQFLPATSLPGTSHGVFEPFQPTGGTLIVHESAWGTVSQIRNVQASRAHLVGSAANPVATGSFSLDVTHGPRQGLGLVAIGFGPSLGGPATTLPGFEQPLFWDAALGAAIATWFVPFDAAGNATLLLNNPGVTPVLNLLAQAAFLDAAGLTLGTTAPLAIVLGQ